MQEKSVGKNAALNMVKTVLSLLFPLITFPYISRVLQVEKLGRVNFAYSIVSYFVLFATLGLKAYGVREGAALRNDRVKFQRFFSQMLTITAVSTAVSSWSRINVQCSIMTDLRDGHSAIVLRGVEEMKESALSAMCTKTCFMGLISGPQ